LGVELTRPRIGISACLLGQEVRLDGGHKRDAFLAEVLGPHVEWVPVCPEVELGLGTPRETLQLVAAPGGPRLITTRTNVDHTDAMSRWSRARLEALAREDLCGYVLKKNSPSCGMEGVKLYSRRGGAMPRRAGRGLFAEALLRRFPSLPVEEEGRLSDLRLRESFVERVFAYRRLKDLFAGRWSLGALVAFHAANKMALLSHSTVRYQKLGRLVAGGKALPRPELRDRYASLFMETLGVPATRPRHTNVLMHMAGHFKRRLDDRGRQELLAAIEEYRRGLVPLAAPLALVRHHVRTLDVTALAGQTYLEPHPLELMGRNHV
jgi:uncharacterized protein YbgA (DUF1722 family)/uncharacterized protein YbbK (DUF523 family)